jgi:hypothetical protein
MFDRAAAARSHGARPALPFCQEITMSRTLLFSALLAAAFAPAADAATFCARNANELRTALSTAASNGQADVINIARGTYLSNKAARFRYQSSEPYGLHLKGGWTLVSNICTFMSYDARATILDGDRQSQVLQIVTTSQYDIVPITVEGMTLRNGYATDSQHAGGLSISGVMHSAPTVTVDRVIVHDNESTLMNQPAVYLESPDHFVRFSNSIVRNNVTFNDAAVRVFSNYGGSSLTGLTVLNNTRGGFAGSVVFGGSAGGMLAQSLVWGNTGGAGDLDVYGVSYWYNRYGTITSVPAIGLGNAAIANPMLLSPTEPRPLATSPLRDAASTDTGVDNRDVFGLARHLGVSIDIGAAEYSP